MNVILSAAAQDQLNRFDTVRRKSAEQAYSSQMGMKDSTESLVKRLEALLLGDMTEQEAIETVKEHRQQTEALQAGQMERIIMPLGTTLEETIDAWRQVRSDVGNQEQLTPKNIALSSKASAEIRSADALIALHNLARSIAKMNTRHTFDSPQVRSYESFALQTYSTQQSLLDFVYAPSVLRIA